MPTTVITNVVTTATTSNRFDLGEICRRVPESTYRPKVFPGLCIRLTRPKTATLIFSTGKLVITGATTATQIPQAVDELNAILTAQQLFYKELT